MGYEGGDGSSKGGGNDSSSNSISTSSSNKQVLRQGDTAMQPRQDQSGFTDNQPAEKPKWIHGNAYRLLTFIRAGYKEIGTKFGMLGNGVVAAQ